MIFQYLLAMINQNFTPKNLNYKRFKERKKEKFNIFPFQNSNDKLLLNSDYKNSNYKNSSLQKISVNLYSN
jgi:hypothetical protein